MFEDDWIIRNIRDIIQFITNVVLKKKSADYEKTGDYMADALYVRLHDLIDKGQVREAEDILQKTAVHSDLKYLAVALDFYSSINKLDNKTLEQCGVSREDIQKNLRKTAKDFGVNPFF